MASPGKHRALTGKEVEMRTPCREKTGRSKEGRLNFPCTVPSFTVKHSPSLSFRGISSGPVAVSGRDSSSAEHSVLPRLGDRVAVHPRKSPPSHPCRKLLWVSVSSLPVHAARLAAVLSPRNHCICRTETQSEPSRRVLCSPSTLLPTLFSWRPSILLLASQRCKGWAVAACWLGHLLGTEWSGERCLGPHAHRLLLLWGSRGPWPGSEMIITSLVSTRLR